MPARVRESDGAPGPHIPVPVTYTCNKSVFTFGPPRKAFPLSGRYGFLTAPLVDTAFVADRPSPRRAGIGRDLVAALLAAGASVVAVSRTRAHLDSLLAEVGAASSRLQVIAVDLADWDATRAALADLGPVDGLVNNAAVACIEGFLDMTKEGLDL